MIKQGLHTLRKTFPTHGTFWLLSDVGSGSRTAPCSGHDVTGPDINLDFPEAQFGCTALLGSSNLEQDSSPTENRHRLDSWPVSVHLAHTKRVAGHQSPGAAGPAAGTLTRLAMIATAISKRVETDHMSQTWNNTVCTRCRPDPELYWFIHVQQGRDAPKRN